MDLTQFDIWTRNTVEDEARKRGVAHPERHSRADLLRLIVRYEYRALKEQEGARKLVTHVVETAVRALPSPRAAFARLRARLPLSAEKPSTKATPAAKHAAAPEPAKAAAPRAARPSARADVRAEWKAPAPPAAQPLAASADDPTESGSQAAPYDQAREDRQERAEQAATQGATTRSFVEEPIRTHSMARLLASQGHRERALAIYEELLAKSSDESLVAEASALRRGGELTFAIGELPSPSSTTTRTELPSSGCRVDCEARGEAELCVRWAVSPEGEARARALLGGGGELALRVVVIRPDVERVVSSEITEHGPVGPSGEWTTQRSASGTRSFAAIGVRDGGRFVSITHSATS